MSKNNLELTEGFNVSAGIGAKLNRVKGNPEFQDQFNLNFSLYYINTSAIPNVFVAAAALPPALQNQLPVFIFGNSDYAGGYQKSKTYFPLTTWTNVNAGLAQQEYGIYRKEFGGGVVNPLIRPFLEIGDLYFQYVATVGGVDYIAFVIVHCPQVAYGSLLDAINSDVFLINMIRYKLVGIGAGAPPLEQFRNQLILINKSIFGKTTDDKVDPETFITGGTFNQNIADIPLQLEVNKNKSIGFYINFNCIQFSWSVTVEKTRKITL